MYEAFFKRVVDLVASSALLILTAPLTFGAALFIWLEDRRSPIFRQERIGRSERVFTIFKLRTMSTGTASLASSQASDLQVTRTGSVLRRTNIDELPQLVNIVRGEMSLVGPRPALPSQTELIRLRRSSDAYRVRPGLTGLAQVRAYDDMPEVEKAGHDAEYARKVTLRVDLSILLRTFFYLLKPPPRY